MTETDGDAARTIADAFVAARAARRALPEYPGAFPASLANGYHVQDLAIRAVDDAIVGWKLGRVPDHWQARAGTNRFAGPVFASLVRDAQSDPLDMPVFEAGFAAAEAEFLLRIGSEPPAGQREFDMDEAADLIDAIHAGIEIASSPFPGIMANGPAVSVSDFGNNNGLVIGPEIAHWRTSGFESWEVVTTIDSVEVGRATTGTMLDGAVGAVRHLLEHLARRGIAVPAGTWVSTGAVTGVHEVRPGQRVEARFGEAHRVACRIVATA